MVCCMLIQVVLMGFGDVGWILLFVVVLLLCYFDVTTLWFCCLDCFVIYDKFWFDFRCILDLFVSCGFVAILVGLAGLLSCCWVWGWLGALCFVFGVLLLLGDLMRIWGTIVGLFTV